MPEVPTAPFLPLPGGKGKKGEGRPTDLGDRGGGEGSGQGERKEVRGEGEECKIGDVLSSIGFGRNY